MDIGRSVSIDYDFEDLLDSFERKFAKKLAQRAPPAEAQAAKQSLVPATDHVFDPSDFPEELSLLLTQVHEVAISNKQKSPVNGSEASDQWDKTIGREIMRSEIRSTMAKLKMLDEYAVDTVDATSGQKTTIASLKRRNRELDDDLQALRKQKKAAEIKLRDIEETHDTHQNRVKMIEDKLLLLQTERGEQDIKLRELESSTYHLTVDKKRLEKNVAMLRTELLASHHKVSEQKLKTTQAERREQDLEARAAELKVSESALSDRVKELHEVQSQMLDEMKKVVESKDAPAARKALNNLSQQRSRIVGKIASLLTKRNGSGVDQLDSDPPEPLGVEDTINASEQGLANSEFGQSQCLVESSGASPALDSPVAVRQHSIDGSAFQKKSSFMDIFRSPGNGGGYLQQRSNERSNVVPSTLSRSSRQQIYEANLFRSRESAERETEVLRDVVDNKSSEIERLAQELRDAKDSAALLERELHSERQNRRKENRNLHIVAEDEPRKQMNAIVLQRNKPSTLFEWQGSASRQSSIEGPTNQPSAGA